MAGPDVVLETVQLYRSKTPGVRPGLLLEGQEFVNLADGIRIIGDGVTPVANLPAFPIRVGTTAGTVAAGDALAGKLDTNGDGSQLTGVAKLIRLDPRVYGAKMDGVTDDADAIYQCIARARTVASVSTSPIAYHASRVVIDFSGGRCAISRPIVLSNDAHIVLDNPSWTAIGIWDTTRYMLEISGSNAYPACAFVVVNNPRLDPNKLCRGMLIQNASRTYVENLVIVGFLGKGLTMGPSSWLSRIKGGNIHEWDSADTTNLRNPAKRAGTGLEVLSGAGDIDIDIDVGWCAVCVDHGASGPVRYRGHWYCSSDTVAIDGDVFVHRNNGGRAMLDHCYLDTGHVRYYGGELEISDACFFFHLSSVTPATLTSYIDAVAIATDQYALIRMNNPGRSDRTKPWIATTEAGGFNWKNISAYAKTGGTSQNRIVDPFLVEVQSQTGFAGRFVTPATTTTFGFADTTTTYSPELGSSGDDLIVKTGGSVVLTMKRGVAAQFAQPLTAADLGTGYAASTYGGINLSRGPAGGVGYVQFFSAAGVRQGYMGYGAAGGALPLAAETSGTYWNFITSGGAITPKVNGNAIAYDTANVSFGNLTIKPSASAVPGANGQVAVELTSNTQLTFRVKGSDGVVRSASLTLA